MHISNAYRQMGVDSFYRIHSDDYSNPHAHFVMECLEQLWNPKWKEVLDLGCGDGLVTKWIQRSHPSTNIEGCDKFLYERYIKETKCRCHSVSFEEIARGQFQLKKYEICVISYAIDLIPESYIDNFIFNIARMCPNLLVIRPNGKKIEHFILSELRNVKIGKSRATLYTVL